MSILSQTRQKSEYRHTASASQRDLAVRNQSEYCRKIKRLFPGKKPKNNLIPNKSFLFLVNLRAGAGDLYPH